MCFLDWLEKQDDRPGLWLSETFSTSLLKPLNGSQRYLTGSKISTSSIKFLFSDWLEKQDDRPGLWLADTFSTYSLKPLTGINKTWQDARSQRPLPSLCFPGLSEITRWTPWHLIGWDIFNFTSKTAERNSTKLDRKQDLKFLYQVCVFRNDWKKQDGRPGLWLAETFSNSLLKPLNGIQRNLTRSKISTSYLKVVFSDWLEKKQDDRPGLLLVDTFSTYPLNPLIEVKETWPEAKYQRPIPSLCFSGRSEKKWPPKSLIGWDIFDFSSDRRTEFNEIW